MLSEAVLVAYTDIVINGVPAARELPEAAPLCVLTEDLNEALEVLSLRPDHYELYKQCASRGHQLLFWDSFRETERERKRLGKEPVRDLETTKRKYAPLLNATMKANVRSLGLEITLPAEKQLP